MNLRDRPLVSRAAVRKQCKPEVASAVLSLMDEGWIVVEAGHKYRLLCPCAQGGRSIAIPGTPRNDGAAAATILRKASRCPDNHDLM